MWGCWYWHLKSILKIRSISQTIVCKVSVCKIQKELQNMNWTTWAMVDFMFSISKLTNWHFMEAKLESKFCEVKNLVCVVFYFGFWLKTYWHINVILVFRRKSIALGWGLFQKKKVWKVSIDHQNHDLGLLLRATKPLIHKFVMCTIRTW